jgi:phosphatidylglycerol:prolipoprotein diacylglycerol transferase
MHPVLFHLGRLAIHTYGVLVAAGFLIGITVAARRAKSEGIEPERIHDLGVWLIVAGMLGGKLFHILFFWNEFIANWRASGVASLREGFVFYGGFICASLATVVYARRKKLPLAKLADAFAPAIALGHALGRLGCFFEGCCYGRACSLPWAVKFPAGHPMDSLPVHPTQLYEAAGNLAIFAALAAFRKRFDGQVWWLYVLSYGALRFAVEFFRGDYDVRYGGVFTLGHVIAAALIVVALAALWRSGQTAPRRTMAA